MIHIDEGMEKQVLITGFEEMKVLHFDQKPLGTSRIFEMSGTNWRSQKISRIQLSFYRKCFVY